MTDDAWFNEDDWAVIRRAAEATDQEARLLIGRRFLGSSRAAEVAALREVLGIRQRREAEATGGVNGTGFSETDLRLIATVAVHPDRNAGMSRLLEAFGDGTGRTTIRVLRAAQLADQALTYARGNVRSRRQAGARDTA